MFIWTIDPSAAVAPCPTCTAAASDEQHGRRGWTGTPDPHPYGSHGCTTSPGLEPAACRSPSAAGMGGTRNRGWSVRGRRGEMSKNVISLSGFKTVLPHIMWSVQQLYSVRRLIKKMFFLQFSNVQIKIEMWSGFCSCCSRSTISQMWKNVLLCTDFSDYESLKSCPPPAFDSSKVWNLNTADVLCCISLFAVSVFIFYLYCI